MSLQLRLWFYLLRAYVPQICTETLPRGAADTSVHSKRAGTPGTGSSPDFRAALKWVFRGSLRAGGRGTGRGTHCKGFSPVWIIRCTAKLWELLKARAQYSQM